MTKDQPTNIMIDLETLGTEADAAVVAIGACAFGPDVDAEEPEFYMIIDMEDAARYGSISAGTVKWWLKQSRAAREAITMANGVTLPGALLAFRQYLGRFGRNILVWGNGSGFDCVILANAYKAVGEVPPWSPFKDRDLRTLLDLARSKGLNPDSITRQGTHHNALDDARHQADLAQMCMDRVLMGVV